LNAGWSGDKYGHAHAEPLGMIWVFWLMSALPWSFVFIAKLKTLFGGTRKSSSADDGWISYLALWSFMPIAFFTFAHNIIWPYPLPTLPALAVLTMELLARGNAVNSSAMDIRPLGARLAAINFFSPVILLIVAMLYGALLFAGAPERRQRALLLSPPLLLGRVLFGGPRQNDRARSRRRFDRQRSHRFSGDLCRRSAKAAARIARAFRTGKNLRRVCHVARKYCGDGRIPFRIVITGLYFFTATISFVIISQYRNCSPHPVVKLWPTIASYAGSCT
jgi:hypothetical protein